MLTKMEDLTFRKENEVTKTHFYPKITQYGIRLPCRIAVVGQTDSGKMHSIMHSWLGGHISFWRPNITDGFLEPAFFHHCLFCSNGGMSVLEKQILIKQFVTSPDQCLFHIPRFPTKQEVYEFICTTSVLHPIVSKKKDGGKKVITSTDPEDVVYNEDECTAPNRVIIFADLMTEAFSNKGNELTMNLITTKLSHHNNLSVLIVCHELYPKGKSSVLFREQLTGVHLHAIANQQRIRRYVYSFLTDDAEKWQVDNLFNNELDDF